MAYGITNWTRDMSDNTEGRKALDKAKKIEAKKSNEGWCYVRINAMTELHVPCDKNGKPTKDGLKRIEIMKEYLGIK